MDRIIKVRRMRRQHTGRRLTLLDVTLMLTMVVFAPRQAMCVFVIAERPAAVGVMLICLPANIVVFVLRLYYRPWPCNLYVLATAWLAIAVTLSGRRPG